MLAAVVLISFNYLTAKHVQGTNEGWNLFIAYSETNFAEFGVYLTLIVLGPLMENWYVGDCFNMPSLRIQDGDWIFYFRRFCRLTSFFKFS